MTGPLRHERVVPAPEEGIEVAHAPLEEQVAALERALGYNEATRVIARSGGDLGLPSWYLGAGAVAQTVWNQLSGYEPARGLRDYDLVYFDPSDLTAEAERVVEERARRHFSHLGVALDVKNEARVHLWYEKRFGRPIPPYRSTEQAISTWPTTASSVGVRYEGGRFVVYAPFGLSDLFAMVVRPNKALVDQAVYMAKASRWAQLWPKLSVVPWESTDEERDGPTLVDAGLKATRKDLHVHYEGLAEVPYRYAAVVPGGATLFTAGACPLDEGARVVAPGDHRAQAEKAVDNLLAVLGRHGAGPADLVKTTVYVVGARPDLAAVWDVVAARLRPHRPPSTLLGVTVLGYPDQVVEIEGIAALPG